MNLAPTIVPKSDQTNSDDLIAGPRTITITAVVKGSKEQPVWISYEGDENRPYKPSKSMRRLLVTIWGLNAADYIGRRITLYRDPTVKFGGDPVGGIKISHASNIACAIDILLTESRGRRKPYRLEAMTPEDPQPAPDLGTLPPAWDQWTTEERGDYMSTQGLPKLQAWWATITKQEKKSLESRLRNDWKPAAEKVTETATP